MTAESSRMESRMISELTLLKLATSVVSRVSYSLGSMILVSVVWMLEKKELSTVPIRSTYRTLCLVF